MGGLLLLLLGGVLIASPVVIAPGSARSKFEPGTPDWLPKWWKLMTYWADAYDLPVGLVIGWVNHESGGDYTEVSSIGERGFFQIDPVGSPGYKGSEADLLGVPEASFKKLSTDAGFSMEWGCRLVRSYAQDVTGWAMPGLVNGSQDYWRLVKLCHAIGAGSAKSVASKAKSTRWADVSAVLISEGRRSEVDHINDVFSVGAPYGVASAYAFIGASS